MMSSQWRNVKGDNSNLSPSPFYISELMGVIMLLMLCTILLLTCAPSIFMELSGKPQPPTMEVLALSVSGLNVSYTNVSAIWNVVLAMQNPNLISTLYFDHMEGMVLYQEEVVVVSSLRKPIVLGPKEHKMVSFRMWRKDWNIDGDQPRVNEWVVTMLMKDKDAEKIDFSVQMGVWARIKCGWLWTKRVNMNPRCKDLSINLVPKRGFGLWSDDEPRECHVPMLDN